MSSKPSAILILSCQPAEIQERLRQAMRQRVIEKPGAITTDCLSRWKNLIDWVERQASWKPKNKKY